MIKITTGGASTASASQLTYEITEKLCKPYNTNNTMQPIITKTWSVADSENVGSIYYYTMQCVINVTYLPYGACSVCGQKTNTFVEKFVVSFPTSGTISFTDNNGYTDPAYVCTSNANKAQGIDYIGNILISIA